MTRRGHNANKRRHSRLSAGGAGPAAGSPGTAVSSKGRVDTTWHIAVAAFVITAAIFWIVWKWIDPAIATHVGFNSSLQDAMVGFPEFYLTGDFLRDKLSQPGGLACYVSGFLCQTYSVAWLGALLLSLEALAIWLGVYACLLRAASLRAAGRASKHEGSRKSSRPPRLAFLACAVPGILLLGTWTNGFPYPSATVSVILGMYAALLGSMVRPRNVWARLAILLILGMLAFVAGTSALLVFVSLALFLEIMGGSGWGWAAGFLAGAGLVPFAAGMWLYGLSAGESVSLLIPAGLGNWDLTAARNMIQTFGLQDRMVMTARLMWGVYLSAAVCGPICLVVARYAGRLRRIPLVAAWSAGTVLLLAGVFAVVHLTWNDSMHAFFAVEYYSAQHMWDRARLAARGYEWNPYMSCAAAQAAYHTGDLVRELPLFQNPADLLLAKQEPPSSWRKSDLYFDLGYANMSLHHAAEAMEMLGERPALLKRLALINLALGNSDTGRIYLNRLSQVPFQSGWARQYLAKLDVDPNLAADPQIQRLRKCAARNDVVGALSPDQEMLLLLYANRNNRMAFEYMMTYCLLARDLGTFLQQLPRIDDFPDMKLSELWQEALLVGLYRANNHADDLRVAPAVKTRFAEALKIANESSGADQARVRMEPKYADTYFFYYLFRE